MARSGAGDGVPATGCHPERLQRVPPSSRASGASRGICTKDTRCGARAALLGFPRARYPPPMRHRGTTHLGSLRAGARRARYAGMTALSVWIVGCADAPVGWSAGPVDATRVAVVVTPDGTLRPDSLAALAAQIPSPDAAACPGSLVLARAGKQLYAAWWRARADSGALLLAARSADDGQHWSAPAPVDTTDVGVAGCDRAPPALAADSASGYVHLAY